MQHDLRTNRAELAGASARELAFVALIAFTALAVLWWPSVHDAVRSIPDAAAAGNPWWGADARLILWILAWDVHALLTQPAHFFDANIFHPAPDMLAGSEHLLSATLLSGPVYLLTGNPLLAGNVAMLATYVLAAVSMYACLRALACGRPGAAVGAAALAVGPFRVPADLHVLQYPNYVLPLIVCASLAARRGRPLWLTAATLLAGFTSYYVAAMAGALLAVETVLALATAGPRAAARVAGGATLAFALLAVFSIPYARHLGVGLSGDSRAIQAIAGAVYQGHLLDPADRVLGFGWAVVGLAAIGLAGPLVTRHASGARWCRWLSLAVLGALLSVGPAVPVVNDILAATPLRAVTRFLVLAHLGVAGLAADGAALVVRALSQTGLNAVGVRAAAGAALTVAAGLPRALGLGDLPRTALPVWPAVPPAYRRLVAARGPLLEIPGPGLGARNVLVQSDAMYMSTFHWLPLVGGGTAFPPWWWPAVDNELWQLPGPEALQAMADLTGVEWILIHVADTPAEALARWEDLPGRMPDAVTRVLDVGPDILLHVRLPPRRPWADALARGEVLPERSALGTPLVPLGADAARGRILYPVSHRWANAGGRLAMWLTVENLGTADWPALLPPGAADRHLVVVTATWYPGVGSPPLPAERIRLPRDLTAADRVVFNAQLAVPTRPGRYMLVLSLTQPEGARFEASGEARLVVEVREPTSR